MEPPLKVRRGHEERISALPDDLLIGILERLDLRDALRPGAASTRWRHLPHQLSRLHLVPVPFQHRSRTTPRAIFDAFTRATERFLSPCPKCERSRVIKTIILNFFLVLDPDMMASLGRAVEHVVSRGRIERFEFVICSPNATHGAPRLPEHGQHLMTFSRACHGAFRWLTGLYLKDLAFGGSDIGDLIRACHKLVHLHLTYCDRVEPVGPLKIDAPSSELQLLVLQDCRWTQIQLISLPKRIHLACNAWPHEKPLLHFGDVPSLRQFYMSFGASHGARTQFALTELLPRTTNLSSLGLNFNRKMIWVQPEHPKRLTPIFSNMREVYLFGIFAECDLNWTLFVLEAAPSLHKFHLSRHSCLSDDAKKTNMAWELSKNSKHLNLKLMVMQGFEAEPKVMNYIRLVMEGATCLERIELICDENLCDACNLINLQSPRRSTKIKVSRRQVQEQLTHGFSSPVQIIIS